MQNKGNRHFDGSFELTNIQTPRASDRIGYAKLDPHEAKVIPGTGKAPADGKVDVKLDGMSQFSIYAGYGTGEGNLKFRVFVTSDWYSLDKGRKMAFAQRAYQVMQLCGLDYPMFEVRCRSNGRRVAHHGDLFGMSIDE